MYPESILDLIKSNETVCATGRSAVKYIKPLIDDTVTIQFCNTCDESTTALSSSPATPTVFILEGEEKRKAKEFDHWFLIQENIGIIGHMSKVKELVNV